ncbi:lysophospholipid acyltransferase family protein [Marinilongibacter aquaticus]|uniref:lysophospholipid acyltransferase family protein n=1 Tax=Marinilongibacter aquaticus TaxID=2975157 RepID=UPI0021BD15B1|nr:lysophospholipid acyltransferase family protein [Marinilongibacter aquaticus]UBM59695.1 lysophospholipid acyltransferase family protein [Marinilongibacter aquaticus]
MKAVAFYLSLPFIYAVSYLPFPVLYAVSDVLIYPVLYKLLAYRKAVVRKNLENAFPEKTEQERIEIEVRFYHYLCDLFVESIKSFTISEKELRKRVHLEETKRLFEELEAMDLDGVLTMGHYGNYEWLVQAFDLLIYQQVLAPYHVLANPYFDRLFLKARSRFGTVLFPTRETMWAIRQKRERHFVVGLANDQSAPPKQSYWTTFLNQDTSFFWGTEKIPKKYGMPVIFVRMTRPQRGYYSIGFEWITKEPQKDLDGAILEKHAQLLEEQIKEKPELWLWSHKRWKHKRPHN